MDSKTLTIILVAFVCVLFFPVVIAMAAGIVGVLGSMIGGAFGLIGGIFGAIFGVIAGIFGAIFGGLGWIFRGAFHCAWPFHFFSGDLFAIFIIVLVIAIIARSKKSISRR